MGKKVILAVAGAGKTYRICHAIDPEKRNLIIAYTHENINNIQNELIDAFGRIPERTEVTTFHSFVYQFFLCPYEPVILEAFKKNRFERNSVTIVDPPERNIKRNGKSYHNPKYRGDSNFEHYICGNDYYCCYMSKLIKKANSKTNRLFQRAFEGINKFYDHISIDEFQDFREYDFELLSELIKNCDTVTVVGDYFQHSVVAKNNAGKPFKVKKRYVTYEEYIDILTKLRLDIDSESLAKTRRCPQSVCDYVQRKLKIPIDADNGNVGILRFVDDSNEISVILENSGIVKLVYSDASTYSFNCINWGYSKGDTYSSVCVILTDKLSELDSENFDIFSISNIVRNKLYIAMTRTKGDLYLVKKTGFDKLRINTKRFKSHF